MNVPSRDVQRPGATCQAIVCSISQRTFESREKMLLPLLLQIAAELHERFLAARTVMGWRLDYQGFRVPDERERLGQGRLEGRFEMLDLQWPTIR
ncbi:MAG: hypothetical protein ACRELY_13125 [Polyangiaceae bacterium]